MPTPADRPLRRFDAPSLACHALDLRLRHTFRTAHGPSDSRHNLLLELRQGDHLAWGEAAPLERNAQSFGSASRAIAKMSQGLGDPRCFADAAAGTAIPGQPAAEAAVDMALRDLAGKRLDVPLYEMLGLDPRKTPLTTYTIGLDTPEAMVRKAREAAEFQILKIKLGGDQDRAVMEALRDVTDQRLVVDANGGWTFDEARQNLEWLTKVGVEAVEQPLPAGELAATRELRRQSPLPLFADESVDRAADIPRLVDAFDGINIKLMKCGGLGEALRMIAVARAHGLKILLGCMVESSLAITAAAQISPLVDFADLDGNLLLAEDPFIGVKVTDGRLVLPDEPGLGVRPRSSEPLPWRES